MNKKRHISNSEICLFYKVLFAYWVIYASIYKGMTMLRARVLHLPYY